MGLHEAAGFARNFAVMVRVEGPDPKGLKMRKHAFHQYNSGKTTLSASGMLLPGTLYDIDAAKRISGGDGEGLLLVVTVASVIEPFLSQQLRQSISQGRPQLIPGAQINVMLEGKLRLENEIKDNLDKEDSQWLTAQLIRLVDVPMSSFALQSLVKASSGSPDHGWEVGWSLASHDNGARTNNGNGSIVVSQRHLAMEDSANPGSIGRSTAGIAILGVSFHLKDLPNIAMSPSNRRGDFLLAVGSPFGILSPMHFFNSISVGMISNCYPPRSSAISLLMADIRCLPGMEGGPVFGELANFVGILSRPLRQNSTSAEIQLVIPWEAIATACCDLLLKEPQNAEKGIHINKENLSAVGNTYSHHSNGHLSYKYSNLNSHLSSPLPVQKATTSICLITVDEGVWASGVLLNSEGLILTNAHLLEPWRFGKTTVSGGRNRIESEVHPFPLEEYALGRYEEVEDDLRGHILTSTSLNIVATSQAENLSYKGHRNIRVCFDHIEPRIWFDAKVVYVSKGPLDVALLKLEYVPDQLCPISVDFACPSVGSKAYVIGHGLFGPRNGLLPLVCSGVVAKVVKTKELAKGQSIHGGDPHIPAMVETTAAVHPGCSGGAVINSDGFMIGLVTSNARHGGGTVIPHLNFSIPCAVLTPIFEFSRDMKEVSLLACLDQPNEHLSLVWALMPPLSPKPSPPLPTLPESLLEDTDKQGKGSRFAKFISEREKILRKSAHVGKAECATNITIPSKL